MVSCAVETGSDSTFHLSMKKCSKCLQDKPIGEFYRKSRGDLNSHCKECTRARSHARYRSHRDELKAKQKEYYRAHADERRAYMKNSELMKTHYQKPEVKARMNGYIKISNARYPEKRKARQLFNNAIAAGRIQRGTICSQCSSAKKVEAHHSDYSKPFEVEWLCVPCHRKRHRRVGP